MPNANDILKVAAVVFLLAVGVAALFIGIWNTIHGIAVPPEVETVIGAGIGYALTALGVQHGVVLANGVAKDTATAVVKATTDAAQKS